MAEHRSILKNNQITHYPRISFTPQTVTALPKTGKPIFLLCIGVTFRISNGARARHLILHEKRNRDLAKQTL